MALTKATQNVIVPDIVTTNTTQTITGTKTFTATIVGNTATSTKLITARTINGIAFDGTADITIPTSGGSSSAKAWVNFNGTGTIGANQTIRSSFNVSSVTKSALGDYTVNFVTPMADVNYSVIGSCSQDTAFTNAIGINSSSLSITTGGVRLLLTGAATSTQAPRDLAYCNVAIFGN